MESIGTKEFLCLHKIYDKIAKESASEFFGIRILSAYPKSDEIYYPEHPKMAGNQGTVSTKRGKFMNF